MPTPDTLQFVPLTQGLDTDTDPNSLAAGKLVIAENLSFNTPGRLEKRTGTQPLKRRTYGDVQVSSSAGVASFQTDLLHFDGQSVRQYVDNAERWTPAGHFNPMAVEAQWLVSNPLLKSAPTGDYSGVAALDSAVANGFSYVTYNVDDDLYVKILASQDNTIARDTKLGSSLRFAQVAATQNTAYVFYVSSIDRLYVAPINPFEPSTLGQLPLVQLNPNMGPNGSGFIYDVASDLTSTYVGYCDLGNQVVVKKFSSTFLSSDWARTLSPTGAQTNRALSLALGQDTSGSNLLVAVSCESNASTGNVRVSFVDPTFGNEVFSQQLNGDTTDVIEKATATLRSGTLNVWLQTRDAGSRRSVIRYTTVVNKDAGLVATGSKMIDCRDLHLASKAWVQGDRSYVTTCFNEEGADAATNRPRQNAFFVFDSLGNIVGRQLVGEAFTWSEDSTFVKVHQLPKPSRIDVSNLVVPLLRRKFASVATIVDDTPQLTPIIGAAKLTVDHDIKLTKQQQSNNLLLVGGYPKIFDGAAVTEHGFNAYPTITSANVFHGGGGIDQDGTYLYSFVYEWEDDSGQTHQSAPSEEIAIAVNGATSGSARVEFQVKTLKLTEKRGVKLVGYRSVASPTEDQQALQKQFTVLNDIALNNDPTAWTFSVTDDKSDSEIAGNRNIYTAGGALANIACPPARFSCATKNRIFVGAGDTDARVYFSKLQSAGIAIEFSKGLSFIVDRTSGPITALGTIDDKLVVFKRHQTYIVYGSGPDDTGNNGQFEEPQLLSRDIGCTNPNSLVSIPGQLIFESSKGVYSVDGAGAFSFIGAEARALFDGNTIVGAQAVPGTNEVRFALAEGGAAVYNYYVKSWCDFTHGSATGCALWNDTYVYSKTDGTVVVDEPGSFADGTNPIALRIKTGLIAIAGPTGQQRVRKLWLVGDYKSPHNVRVKVYLDGSPAASETFIVNVADIVQPQAWGDDATWGASSPWGGTFRPEIPGLHLKKQKCRSIQIEVEELEPEGEGFRMRGIGMAVGTYPGLTRLPDANRR